MTNLSIWGAKDSGSICPALFANHLLIWPAKEKGSKVLDKICLVILELFCKHREKLSGVYSLGYVVVLVQKPMNVQLAHTLTEIADQLCSFIF